MIALIAVGTVIPAFGQDRHYTGGYYRKDGTYVNGHYSTNPNDSRNDNWSTKGNYNPYTGKEGTVDPNRGTGHTGSSFGNGRKGYGF